MRRFIKGMTIALALCTLSACASNGTTGTTAGNPPAQTESTVPATKEAVDTEVNAETPAATEAVTKPEEAGARPSDFEAWTPEDMISYFKEEGVFTHDNWFYNSTGADLTGTGMSYSIMYMSDDGTVALMITWFDPASKDASVAEHRAYVAENKKTSEATGAIIVDHLVGGFAFSFSSNADIDVAEAASAAYEKLLTDINLTPEY